MDSRKNYGVEESWLVRDATGVPYSERFRDRYFSADGGLEESRFVFLEGNGLPDRWRTSPVFTIGELGFGTGLNFLLTYKTWKETAAPSSRLHFVSFERYPFTGESMYEALLAFPDLAEEAALLIAHLPFHSAGFHRLSFPGNVQLTLCYGDANELLEQLHGNVDAWYLDGFAPDRNPELWTERVIDAIARRSRSGATLATYSAASEVRRRLQARGFEIEKVPGFGRKREMLRGRLANGAAQATPAPSRVAIVGGGLAGASLARAFSARGAEVMLFEQRPRLSSQASGNPAGVLMPHLSLVPDALGRFFLSGYEYTLHCLRRFPTSIEPPIAERRGVIRLASSDRLMKLADDVPSLGLPPEIVRRVGTVEQELLSGFSGKIPGLFFSQGGWISPPDFCRALIQSCGKSVQQNLETKVTSFQRSGQGWAVFHEQQTLCETDVLILAGGYECMEFSEVKWLPLEKVRGQALLIAANEMTERLKTVICYDGFITPSYLGRHFVGATYDHDDDRTDPREEQNRNLIERLQAAVPGLPIEYTGTETSRVAFRTMSRDRLPMVGRVPDLGRFAESFLTSGRLVESAIPGLYVSLGHGSRGLISCPLSAEIIAAEAYGEPLPIEEDLLEAIRPERFLQRLLLRGLELSDENLQTLKVKPRTTSAPIRAGG